MSAKILTLRKYLVRVTKKGEGVTRFTRRSKRTAVRELAMLRVEFTEADRIELERMVA